MKRLLIALAAMVLGPPALAVTNPPPLASNKAVVDEADILTASEEAALESQIRTIYQTTHHRLAVLIMPTLDDQPVQDYINNAFRYYKLGNATRNDGVLLLVSMKAPRRLQIEVGTGLEGVLTDGLSTRITDGMVPLMKAGDFSGALTQGVGEIGEAVAEEQVTPQLLASTQQTAAQKAESKDAALVFGIFMAILVVGSGVVIFLMIRSSRRKAREAQERHERLMRSIEERRRIAGEEARQRAAEKAREPKPTPPPVQTHKPSPPRGGSAAQPPRHDRNEQIRRQVQDAEIQRQARQRREREEREESERAARRRREDDDRRSRDSWSSSSSSSSSWGSSSSGSSSNDSYDSGGSSSGGGGGSDW